MSGKRRIDLTNQIVGRLTVLSLDSRRGNAGQYYWNCKCACGKEKSIQQGALIRGDIRSCGCLLQEFRANELPKITVTRNSLPYSEASFNGLYHRYKSRAKVIKQEFLINKEDFRRLTSSSCHYCGVAPERECLIGSKKTCNGYYKYNGLDRVDNSKGYTLHNVVPCCEMCNKAKRDLSSQVFESWINRLIAFRSDKLER